jgi:hypothetical protein
MWRLAALLVLLLATAPLVLVSARPVAVPVALAVLLCALGLVLRSTPVLAGGLAVALGAYALALAITGGRPRLAGAAGVGVLIALLLEVGDFDVRFRRLALGPGVAAAQLRHFATTAALGAVGSFTLIAAASVLAGALTLRWTPVVAVIGAVAALGALAAAVRYSSERSR